MTVTFRHTQVLDYMQNGGGGGKKQYLKFANTVMLYFKFKQY